MGTFIEQNDTLQITKDQGFPAELDLETHLRTPYKSEDFLGKVFQFKDKPAIRNYQVPPVRNFFVENRLGKWIYWGLIQITEVHHDYGAKTTSGSFTISYIYTPEEMKKAYKLIDRRKEMDFFNEKS